MLLFHSNIEYSIQRFSLLLRWDKDEFRLHQILVTTNNQLIGAIDIGITTITDTRTRTHTLHILYVMYLVCT